MAETGAFVGYPNLTRQAAKLRKAAAGRDVNSLPDPRTYAFVSGLLGEAPGEQGFSVLHPDASGIRKAADAGYVGGLLAMAAPAAKGLPLGASIKPVAAAPQAEALETARKNAVRMLGLRESNTAAERAKALGFAEGAPMYHATEKDFQSFVPSRAGKLGPGVYMSPSAKYAEKYAGENAQVMPLLTRGRFATDDERIAIADEVRERLAEATPDFSVQEWKSKVNDALRARGFDGSDMDLERSVINPSKIRSRFAAFDPARINENNLLAGAAGGWLGEPIYSGLLEDR